MQIIIISHMYPSNIRPVMGVFVQQQARALVALGHGITVICPTPWIPKWIPGLPQRWKEFQNLPKEEQDGDITIYFPRGIVIPKSLDRWRGRLYYHSLKLFFVKLFKRSTFNLIHAHKALTSGDLGQLLTKKYHLPLIITLHGGDVLINAHKNAAEKKRILKVLNQADQICMVSNQLKQKTLNLDDRAKVRPDIRVIYNGIQPERTLSPLNWNKNDKIIRFISIGGLIRQKNYSQVFRALRNLDRKKYNFHYTIIGEGWDRDFYENQIKGSNLADVVTLAGAMPHPQAMAYLKESDVFILTSISEGFGVVYLEAMYYGLVTIGSKGEAIEEVIRHGENGFLVNPDDPQELQSLLGDILDGKYNLDNIGRFAKETVWPRFSWENNARAYEKVYNKFNIDSRDN